MNCVHMCVCARKLPCGSPSTTPFVTLAWVTWPYCTDGARFIPRVAGSKWSVEDSFDGAGERAHRLRITECPAGFALVRGQNRPQTDQCEKCPGTFPFGYALKTQRWTGNDSLTSDSTLALTNVCLEVCPCLCVLICCGSFATICVQLSRPLLFPVPSLPPPPCPFISMSQCPLGMSCSGGTRVVPTRGFWANPERAVLDFQNVSMYDPQIRAARARRSWTEDSDLTAHKCSTSFCLEDWRCREGHHGRLCALCNSTQIDGKFFAMGANGCVLCEEESIANAWIIVAFCSLFGSILYYLAVWRVWIRFESTEGCINRLGVFFTNCAARISDPIMKHIINPILGTDERASKKKNFSILGYLKVVISFCQVSNARSARVSST